MHNLLTKPCIRVQVNDGEVRRADLPGTLKLLSTDRITTFPALRAHQQHAWHALLSQLGALACEESQTKRMPASRRDWEKALRRLAPGWKRDAPWHLVPIEEQMPGFLQPAGHESYPREPRVRTTPDGIDIVIATKNHEVKTLAAAEGDADDWLFALVTTQTAGGYSGRGNYGVSRMNGGYASRICVGLRPATGGPGAWFRHDVERLRAEWRKEGQRPPAAEALLWLRPWDGEEQLDLDTLHPGYIESCRRIRLIATSMGIEARTRSSRKSRINAAGQLGNVGDHWMPVEADGGKALTLGERGFRYDALSAILGPEYAPHGAMRTGGAKGRWRLVARGLARGQGKTAGYHERNDIVVNNALAKRLGTPAGRAEIRADAKALIDVARDTAKAVWAATNRLAAPTSQTNEPPAAARRQSERLENYVDEVFFGALDTLASTPKKERQEIVDRFRSELATAAQTLVDAAIREAGGGRRDRHLARAAARSTVAAILRRQRKEKVGGDKAAAERRE